MKLVKQPDGSNLCGQACVAMVCGISLKEAILLVKTEGETATKHLKRAFHAMDIKHGEKRVRGFPRDGSALLFFRSDDDKSAHWVVWHNKKYYDPISGVFRKVPKHLINACLTSYLSVEIK